MPRQAHGRSLYNSGPSKTKKRKPQRGKGLNALEAAEKEYPDTFKIPQHRLGYTSDDDEQPRTRDDADERSSKRRKVEGKRDKNNDDEEEADDGSEVDGQEFHVGMDEDDDDSDIDSDEAFNESDEERFADFTFRGSGPGGNETAARENTKKNRVKSRTLDLQEDDSEEVKDGNTPSGDDDEEDLGEGAIDLTSAWDGGNGATDKPTGSKRSKLQVPQARRASVDSSEQSVESDGDDESEDTEVEPSGVSASENDADEETSSRLRSFVNGLTPSEHKDAKKPPEKLRKSLPDRPSQFGLGSAGLSASDLMQYITDPAQRQSLKILQQAEREEPSNYKGGVPGKLAPPLAKRQQDRLDRVAAYDKGKEQMGRWVDTIKEHRRAEHVSFPAIDVAKASASNIKSLQPLSNSEPRTGLEAKIRQIMQESGLVTDRANGEEGREAQYEELAVKQIPLEEVQARRRELRLQRDLMFREEIRARRIKKIKSKAYRRVHRNERNKREVEERERLRQMGGLNSDEERAENDKRRAEERMGARHRESKWAKGVKSSGQTSWNEDAKVGVSELARRDEELRRRIEGKNAANSDGEESSGSDSVDDSEAEESRFREKVELLDNVDASSHGSRLANMPFMQKAMADQKAQNEADWTQLRRALDEGMDDSEGSGSDDERPTRQHFGKKSKPVKAAIAPLKVSEFDERLSEDEQGMSDDNTVAPVVSNTRAPAAPLHGHEGQRPVTTSAGSLKKADQSTALDDYTSPSESEHGDAADDLADEIFAGEDDREMAIRFNQEKADLIKEEDDQIIDTSLPGWGSWTGHGISRRRPKANPQDLKVIQGVKASQRQDARLERVMINEKKTKKNVKYLAPELPHPYESRAQYERALRLPMGPEWSTRKHFQDAIKPRVLVKQGNVIQPLIRPTV